MNPPEVLLRGIGITRRWGGLVAVDDVSIDVRRGEVHAVIGTNGAGKSTLVNILSGELPPSAGNVELLGDDVTGWSQPRRAQAGIGRTYQRSTIYPGFTVFENCRLAAQAAHQKPWQWWRDARRCEVSTAAGHEAAARAGLDARLEHDAGLLSHGQMRQLEVAMCLATDPQVLLLDEPLAGMGAEETERMLALLAELRPSHAILLVEHDMDAVFRVADRITVMVNGAVIACDTPDAVRVNPEVQTAYLGAGIEMSATETIVDARAIHAWYGSSHVLHGVDLQIGRGQTLGLLGRNGMGKSTLIRTLLGHVRQRDGHIGLFGQDASRFRPHQVARLGVAYVPEGRGVFPNLSVRENLVMAARPGRGGGHDWSLERVLETFPRLAERMTNLGSQLSGGEQQMVAIGRALMTQPELIILDEATEGLAPLIVAEIWRVVEDIRASGIATLIVDRDYHRVLRHSDRAVVLQKGQVVLAGDADEVAGSEALSGYLGV